MTSVSGLSKREKRRSISLAVMAIFPPLCNMQQHVMIALTLGYFRSHQTRAPTLVYTELDTEMKLKSGFVQVSHCMNLVRYC